MNIIYFSGLFFGIIIVLVFVDNGEGARPMGERNGSGSGGGSSGGKAAGSVMKWGGGSQWGSKKKAKRAEEAAKNIKRKTSGDSRLCRFGVECTRTDCWFTHPKGGSGSGCGSGGGGGSGGKGGAGGGGGGGGSGSTHSCRTKQFKRQKVSSVGSGKKTTFGDGDSD